MPGLITSSDRALITVRKVFDALIPVSFANFGISGRVDRVDG
jgi:hypothetical protein